MTKIPSLNITVEEFTTPYVVSVEAEATLDQALELMQEHGIRHLPVLQGESLEGIISERDVLTHMGKSWSHMIRVQDIMSQEPLTVSLNDSLGSVAYQLSYHKVGSALVFDENNKLFGIFTTTDALNALVELAFPEVKMTVEISAT